MRKIAFILAVLFPGLALSPAKAASVSDVVATGTVLTATGSKKTVGADVYLFPDETRMGKVTSFAHARSTVDGRFKIHLIPADNIRAAGAGNDGWLNLIMIAVKGDRYGVLHLSRKYTADRWVDRSQLNNRAATTRSSAADLSLAVRTANKRSAIPQSSHMVALAAKSGAPPRPGASTMTLATAPATIYPNQPTTVARIESAIDMKAHFTYGQKADSSIDVQTKSDVPDAKWGVTGEVHIGNESVGEIGDEFAEYYAKYYKTTFDYGDFTRCAAGWLCFTDREAFRWTGGWQAGFTAVKGQCIDGAKSQWYSKQNTKTVRKYQGQNIKYTAAANVGGLAFGSTSGYSSYVDTLYTFGTSAVPNYNNFCLEGNNDVWPWAQEVYAFSTP